MKNAWLMCAANPALSHSNRPVFVTVLTRTAIESNYHGCPAPRAKQPTLPLSVHYNINISELILPLTHIQSTLSASGSG